MRVESELSCVAPSLTPPIAGFVAIDVVILLVVFVEEEGVVVVALAVEEEGVVVVALAVEEEEVVVALAVEEEEVVVVGGGAGAEGLKEGEAKGKTPCMLRGKLCGAELPDKMGE